MASYNDPQPDKFMTKWLILAPISISEGEEKPDEEAQKAAFAKDFLAEYDGELNVRPTPDWVNKIGGKEYTWKLVDSKQDIVDLVEIYGEKEFVIAYAWAEISMPEERKVILGIGSDDAVKVWLNGELVHEILGQ